MSLQPHFYLGPIEVVSDENLTLAAVWHSQALQRSVQYYGNHVSLPSASDLPEGLQPAFQPNFPESFFLPTLHIQKAPVHVPMSMDSLFAQFQMNSLDQQVTALFGSTRMVSVAECLHL